MKKSVGELKKGISPKKQAERAEKARQVRARAEEVCVIVYLQHVYILCFIVCVQAAYVVACIQAACPN